jgi:gamma-glutamylcyclotransferase
VDSYFAIIHATKPQKLKKRKKLRITTRYRYPSYPSPTLTMKPTIYFGYGSNLWQHQMRLRCPDSQYLGVARLDNYTWLINDRGYANVVEQAAAAALQVRLPLEPQAQAPVQVQHEPQAQAVLVPSDSVPIYSTVVYGLVYALSHADEARLDVNEGVPVAYTKEYLPCAFWPGAADGHVDVEKPPAETRDMLVYIDRKRMTADKPRDEYVYRMNRGIEDAAARGVPGAYVSGVMRKFIPEEGEGQKEYMRGFAETQAQRFRDESGVIE